MHALHGEALLTAWEEGQPEHDLTRALIVLSHALPERERASLARLPIEDRNVLLLRLRELTFGPLLAGVCRCDGCGVALEFVVPVPSLVEAIANESRCETLAMRKVTTNDLLALRAITDTAEASRLLLERCGGSGASSAARDAFDALHAAAELRCAIECEECSHAQTLDLDIARFLWMEVRAAAQRLLGDIRDLAGAFGWSESDITRMSSARRNAYLELLSA